MNKRTLGTDYILFALLLLVSSCGINHLHESGDSSSAPFKIYGKKWQTHMLRPINAELIMQDDNLITGTPQISYPEAKEAFRKIDRTPVRAVEDIDLRAVIILDRDTLMILKDCNVILNSRGHRIKCCDVNKFLQDLKCAGLDEAIQFPTELYGCD